MSTLYIDRKNIEIKVEKDILAFYEDGKRYGTVPIQLLSRVVLRGDAILRANVLGKLGAHGVGLIFLSGRYAKPSIFHPALHNDATYRMSQVKCALNPTFQLAQAQTFVDEKIQSQIEFVDGLIQEHIAHQNGLKAISSQLQQARSRVFDTGNLEALRGLEGNASKQYFEVFRHLVPAAFQFKGRNRRPPKDPFNALLSLGYTLLHAEAVLKLYEMGLDPFVGFLHEPLFGRESLACDVIEKFRVQVDEFVWELVQSKRISERHFSSTETGCFLGKEGRQYFYEAWELKLQVLRKLLNSYLEQLRQHITATAITYT